LHDADARKDDAAIEGQRESEAMSRIEELFARNRAWAKRIKEINPDFFLNLSRQQKPEYLWIGCSDSRVPANQIIDLPPGEVFVHRNIANVVVPSDLNCLSVIQFAVEVLHVKHIIVCGHYGCGGVRASLEPVDHGLIDNWLRHIRAVRRLHAHEFEHLARDGGGDHGTDAADVAVDRLCELNVIEQVNNVCGTTIVRDAWRRGDRLTVEGWVYSIKDGVLHGLCSRGPNSADRDFAPAAAAPRVAESSG
jgi:carbonic anhydrase